MVSPSIESVRDNDLYHDAKTVRHFIFCLILGLVLRLPNKLITADAIAGLAQTISR